jgi:hypothetical protein
MTLGQEKEEPCGLLLSGPIVLRLVGRVGGIVTEITGLDINTHVHC